MCWVTKGFPSIFKVKGLIRTTENIDSRQAGLREQQKKNPLLTLVPIPCLTFLFPMHIQARLQYF